MNCSHHRHTMVVSGIGPSLHKTSRQPKVTHTFRRPHDMVLLFSFELLVFLPFLRFLYRSTLQHETCKQYPVNFQVKMNFHNACALLGFLLPELQDDFVGLDDTPDLCMLKVSPWVTQKNHLVSLDMMILKPINTYHNIVSSPNVPTLPISPSI